MSEFAEKTQKVVISDSVGGTTWANSRVLEGAVAEAVARLRREPGKNVVVVAPELGRELMRRGLVDDYLHAVMPVILGKGHPFFGPLEGQQTLRLVEVKHFKAGELFHLYETAR
jgi:dihydrofolate reductase